MISLEFKNEKLNFDCAEMYLDDEGLQDLERAINFMKLRKTDHVDFFSESWGGRELTGFALNNGNAAVQYLKIIFIDAIQKK
jgi:hypothetical protein